MNHRSSRSSVDTMEKPAARSSLATVSGSTPCAGLPPRWPGGAVFALLRGRKSMIATRPPGRSARKMLAFMVAGSLK